MEGTEEGGQRIVNQSRAAVAGPGEEGNQLLSFFLGNFHSENPNRNFGSAAEESFSGFLDVASGQRGIHGISGEGNEPAEGIIQGQGYRNFG